MVTLHSRSHPLVKRLRALKARGDDDLLLLEGPKLVLEALAAGLRVVEAAASPRALRGPAGERALAGLRARRLPVRELADELLDSLSELRTSQGLLAVAHRPAPDAARLFSPPALVVVPVDVQDPGNLGGLLRTAEAAGASGALLAGACADPFSWKALRGSMGSALRLPLQRQALPDALRLLRERGLRLVGTAADAPRTHDQIDWRGPLALLLGSEGGGLPDDLPVDEQVRIPMRPPVESLNVGVAAGVLLFEAARQRRSP